jgi:hypothetical protein
MPVKKNIEIQMDIRPSVPKADMEAFRKACKVTGETMTSVVRRLVLKVARGDRDLIDRIVT